MVQDSEAGTLVPAVSPEERTTMKGLEARHKDSEPDESTPGQP